MKIQTEMLMSFFVIFKLFLTFLNSLIFCRHFRKNAETLINGHCEASPLPQQPKPTQSGKKKKKLKLKKKLSRYCNVDRKLLFYIACTEPVHTKKNVAQMLAKRFVSLKKIEGREDYHDFCVSTFFGENVSFFSSFCRF